MNLNIFFFFLDLYIKFYKIFFFIFPSRILLPQLSVVSGLFYNRPCSVSSGLKLICLELTQHRSDKVSLFFAEDFW